MNRGNLGSQGTWSARLGAWFVKDVTELIKFLTDKSNMLVTIMVVAALVWVIFWMHWLVVEPPYVYIVYLIYLAGLAAAVLLLVGGAMAGGGWGKAKLQAKWNAGAEDARALLNLENIDYKHAEALYWIMKKEGERFSAYVFNIHRELVAHGFLVFDDPETQYLDKTYFRVRKAVWDKINSPGYEWAYRMRLGSNAPWLSTRY